MTDLVRFETKFLFLGHHMRASHSCADLPCRTYHIRTVPSFVAQDQDHLNNTSTSLEVMVPTIVNLIDVLIDRETTACDCEQLAASMT